MYSPFRQHQQHWVTKATASVLCASVVMTDVPERRASTAGDEGKTAVQITENEQQKDETYLTGLPLAGLLAGLVLVVFLITLDISIVAAAIPRITDESVWILIRRAGTDNV